MVQERVKGKAKTGQRKRVFEKAETREENYASDSESEPEEREDVASDGEQEEIDPEKVYVKEERTMVTIAGSDKALDAEMAAIYGSSPTNDKKKKIVEEEEMDSEEERAKKAEDEKNMARLREMRAKREETKRKREEAAAKEAEEAAAGESKKAEEKPVSEEMLALVAGLEKLVLDKGTLNVNQLNQDAAAKKLLKPLMKKAGVKALNKQTLTQLSTAKGKESVFRTKEENKLVFVEKI